MTKRKNCFECPDRTIIPNCHSDCPHGAYTPARDRHNSNKDEFISYMVDKKANRRRHYR